MTYESVDIRKIVRVRLYNLRASLKLTQSEFAKRVGVSTTTISNLEKTKTTISGQTLADISRTTGVSLDWLLGFTGTDSEPLFLNEIVHLNAPKTRDNSMSPDIRYIEEHYPYIFETVDYKIWKAGKNISDAFKAAWELE